MNKRGQKIQTGSPAATLIGVITLLFVFYILFLPAEERAELLEDTDFDEEEDYERTILDEAPGRLEFAEKSVFDHNIPNVFLVESRNAVVLATENPFKISKGWFSEQAKSLVFSINDPENTENVVLNFQATESYGTLIISLNGELIFESEVNVQNPAPITLPKTLLRPTNKLVFGVTNGFFTRKRYSLSDVKVVGDVTDIKRQMARNTFTISNTEIDKLDYAFLDFYPLCRQRDVGVLTLELNGRIIYSAPPACDSLNRQDLFAEDLREGRNTLIFKIDRGSYRIEQTRVRTLLKPIEAFVDFFEVKASLYNDVLDKERDIILEIEFIDDDKKKRAEININGIKDVIDQRDFEYERKINSMIREGNNYIEIKPLTELDIVKLEVRVD